MSGAVKGDRRTYSTALRREQAQLTRERILDAARALFVQRGYPAVTMQEIAGEAAVAYQTVYAQFGTKLRLALELCASEFPHVGPTVAMLAEAEAAGDPVAWLRMLGPFARRLYEPCAEVLRFMRESGAIIRSPERCLQKTVLSFSPICPLAVATWAISSPPALVLKLHESPQTIPRSPF